MGLGAEISAYRFLCFKTNIAERSFFALVGGPFRKDEVK